MIDQMKRNILRIIILTALTISIVISCKKDPVVKPVVDPDPIVDPVTPARTIYTTANITDTYPNIFPIANVKNWGPYNVHDPSVLKDGDYYYAFSTDAMYGLAMLKSGIQIRRSKDLIDWEFVGWVFNGLPTKAVTYINQNGGTPFDGVWAPYIMKTANEYRLYYSLSSPTPKLSAIGVATSLKIDGPWVERDLVVTSKDNIVMTNAIDPTVVVDPSGNNYLYYGSAWDGIYILELDPTTGLAKSPGYKGKRIAMRGKTGNTANGNIEGPEIIYNDQFKKYYLFISYDWLSTKYNVRVGRSDSPAGPFTDFDGKDINLETDHVPMILTPYSFKGHLGWQGTGHCSVFRNGDQFLMSHQGRPVADFYYMVMHTRQIFWTEDGWPVVSPERFAATEQTTINKDELSGNWEQIILGYRVVPGYDKEQVTPDLQVATTLTLASDGSLNADTKSSWTYSGNQLTMKWSNGFTDKVIVSHGWDWENKRNCLVFTGLNNAGTVIWGKK
jgi:arabinan endo-1,5-alpha-L-arabinosidase